MPLIHGTPNKLNFAGLRRTIAAVPEFHYIHLHGAYSKYDLTDWIMVNLSGRFYICEYIALDSNRKIVDSIMVGFENPNELTYFSLACPLLHN